MTTTAVLPAVERELILPASPARVWRALTDPEELVKWFGERTELDLRPGGGGWMEFDGYGRISIRVETVDPERFLSIRWATTPDVAIDDGPTTLLELTLTPTKDGGTRLHLRERSFTDQAARFENIEGWVHELGDLMDHLATEPWEHPLRRALHLNASADRVWRAERPRRVQDLVEHEEHRRAPTRLGGLVRLPGVRPALRAYRDHRAAPLLGLALGRGQAGRPARRGRPGAAHRVTRQAARRRRHGPPTHRERLRRPRVTQGQRRRLGRRGTARPPAPDRGLNVHGERPSRATQEGADNLTRCCCGSRRSGGDPGSR